MERIWSEQQRAVFNWFETGEFYHPITNQLIHSQHLVVRARAGTGKTTTIIEGVKRAQDPTILVAAFSKIIQKELEARIGSTNGSIRAQTLHSVGYACIRRFRDKVKVDFSANRADTLTEAVCGRFAPDAIKKLVSKLHTKGREMHPHADQPGDLIDIAIRFDCEPDENWANSGFPLEKVEEYALQAMELASNLQSGGTIDGSDMIFLPVRNGWLTGLYDMVVVDEAQDMTTAQLEIAQGVLKQNGRICIVGDDKQAIFGFRGADSSSLDRLKHELNAAELGLTTTYRCGKSIVEIAQKYVPDFEAGPNNPDGVIDAMSAREVLAEAGPGDFVLSRVNAPLVSFALRLLRQGKRTRIAGRDIGKGLVALVKKFKARSVPDFLTKVSRWEEREGTRIRGMMEIAAPGRKATLENKLDEIADKASMLISLADEAKSVTEIETRIENLFMDDGLGVNGMITCSSVHRAKGLEAERVFIMSETLRDYNQEEENICYVAVTRAKSILVWMGEA